MSDADREYFKQRAEEERARAESASSPAAARVHLAMAAKYAALADERPMLHIAPDDGFRKQA